jgi:hypothetical protein
VVSASWIPSPSIAQQSVIDGPSDSVAIERWLVSSPFPAPVEENAGDALLSGPGEAGVFPDRGREAGGAAWMLVRRDGQHTLPLDSLIPDRESPVVTYAHSYVRLQEDRTMILSWEGTGATAASVWVNGRLLRSSEGGPLETSERIRVPIRLGAGWNTLLFRAAEAEGPFGLGASLATERGGATVRIQASRPPGEIRTGPEPWVIASPELATTGEVAWSGNGLFGEVAMEVTAWSRTPIEAVSGRLRGSGLDARGTVRWLTPGTPADLGFWAPLDRLERARSGGQLELELEWDDEKIEQRIPSPAAAPTRDGSRDSSGILLSGWEVRSSPQGSDEGRITPAGPIPGAAGWMISGKWEVPEALEGRDLFLDASASPGDYRIGDQAFDGSDRIPLCSSCREGEDIEILVRSSGAWTSLPRARESIETDSARS